MAVAQGWAAPRHVLILRLLVVTTLIMLSGGLRLSAQEESPRLVLDPASALPGARVTASGWSFPADVPGKVTWSDGTPLADIVTDQAGAFSVTVAVPVVPPGSYIMAAEAQTDTGVARAEATLTVEPATTAEQGNAIAGGGEAPAFNHADAAPSVHTWDRLRVIEVRVHACCGIDKPRAQQLHRTMTEAVVVSERLREQKRDAVPAHRVERRGVGCGAFALVTPAAEGVPALRRPVPHART